VKRSTVTIGVTPIATTPEAAAAAARRRPTIAFSRYAIFACLVVAFSATAATASARSESASPAKSDVQVALDRIIASGVPGAVVLARDGDRTTILAGGYGNVKQKTAVKPTDRFRVGSVTKTFVATVVLQLVGEGKLALDDTVEQHLPGAIPNGKSITVRQLLNMTAGLFDYLNDGDSTVDDRLLKGDLTYRWTPRQLIAISNAHKPKFAPGTSWRYCSTCYVLLGLIAEKVTGHSIGAELRNRIFVPLGLRSTTFDSGPVITGAHAHGYEIVNKQMLDVSVLSPSHGWAAGGLVSNAPDLARFYRALLGGKLLPANLLRAMETTAPMGSGTSRGIYGLGLFKSTFGCGAVYGHPGAIVGYEAYAYNSKDGRHQAVVLVSMGAFSQSTAAGEAIDGALATAYCTR